jgi:hypothetical protein
MFPFPFSFIAPVADIPVERIANAKAMSFNGVDSCILVDNPPSLPGDATISLWTYFNNTPTHGGILGSKNFYVSANSFVLYNSSGDISFLIGNNTGSFLNGTWTPSTALLNNWNHICIVIDTTAQTAQPYFNGVSMGSPLNIGTRNISDISNGMNISGYSTNGQYPPTLRIMDGKIDEVAVFNTVLSAEKITQIYDATAVVGGVPQTANLFTGGLSSSLVYWNRMGDS